MFTGHRRISNIERDRLRQILPDVITALFREGISTFISGAAIGFDTRAAQAVLSVRDAGLAVSLQLAVPCLNQDTRWNRSDRAAYAALMQQADSVLHTSFTPYYNGCMQVRNRYMVEHAAVCIAYFNGEPLGGTAATYRLAQSFHRRILNLCPPKASESQLSLSETESE